MVNISFLFFSKKHFDKKQDVFKKHGPAEYS